MALNFWKTAAAFVSQVRLNKFSQLKSHFINYKQPVLDILRVLLDSPKGAFCVYTQSIECGLSAALLQLTQLA